MMYHVRVFLLSARVQLLEITASPFMLFNALLQPFFIAIIAIYMLRNQANFDAVYVVVGVGLSGLFGITLFTGTSAIARERSQGNLEILEASPAPLFVVLGGKMVGNLALALTSMIMSYVVGAWIFGFPITVDSPISFSVSFLMALFSLWTMGMLFAPLSILWPPVNQFLGGIEYPIFILSGFLFPVLLLPGWVLPISYALPPFWAARALQGSSLGSLDSNEIALSWLILMVTSALLLGIAIWLLQVFLRRARKNGRLGFV